MRRNLKTVYLNLVLVIIPFFTFAQKDCPDIKSEKYKKVMSSAFAKDYEKCPVIITAEYFGDGYLKGYRKPNKLKDMYFFQCVNIGEVGKIASPITNEMSGDFFVIDKNKADVILDLKKGTKLKLTGVTFTQNFFGTEVSTFFIISQFEILN